jgi:hypothetical protein
MAKWYLKLDRSHQKLFWALAFALVVFVGLWPAFLLHGLKGYSYPLGWFWGSLAGLLLFLFLVRLPAAVFKEDKVRKYGSLLWAMVAVFSLFVLAFSALCTFESGWLGGFDAFNFLTAFGGFACPLLILGFLTLKDRFQKAKTAKN